MRYLNTITFFLILIGALNWGLIGFFRFDLVAFMFGDMTALSRIIYSLVGLSGIVQIVLSNQEHKMAKSYVH